MRSFKIIGKPEPRLDGPETVSGSAQYTVDVVLPGTLRVKLLRSPLPHARIRRVDASLTHPLGAEITLDH